MTMKATPQHAAQPGAGGASRRNSRSPSCTLPSTSSGKSNPGPCCQRAQLLGPPVKSVRGLLLQRLDVVQDDLRMEEVRAVDLADESGAVDQEHLEHVRELAPGS